MIPTPTMTRNRNNQRINVKKNLHHQIPTILLKPSLKEGPLNEYLLKEEDEELELSGEIQLPEIAGHRIVGSSQGYLLSVDPTAGDLHATDPITGHHLPLPPSAVFPHVIGVVRHSSSGHVHRFVFNRSYGGFDDELRKSKIETETSLFEGKRGQRSRLVTMKRNRDLQEVDLHDMISLFYKRAILSPSLRTAFVIVDQPLHMLARAQLGGGGGGWDVPFRGCPRVCDLIFHQGLLHAVGDTGTLVVFDDDDRHTALFTGPFVDVEKMQCTKFLVESPDGEDLFLVLRQMTMWRRREGDHVTVYRLDKRDYKWDQVETIGDIAMFLGSNHPVSLSVVADHRHRLRPNSIYFAGEMKDTGIFSMEDKSMQPFKTPNHLQSPYFMIPASTDS